MDSDYVARRDLCFERVVSRSYLEHSYLEHSCLDCNSLGRSYLECRFDCNSLEGSHSLADNPFVNPYFVSTHLDSPARGARPAVENTLAGGSFVMERFLENSLPSHIDLVGIDLGYCARASRRLVDHSCLESWLNSYQQGIP